MGKKQTIYKVIGKGVTAGVSDTKKGAEWIKKQYPKFKLRIIKTLTTKPYGKRLK